LIQARWAWGMQPMAAQAGRQPMPTNPVQAPALVEYAHQCTCSENVCDVSSSRTGM